MGYFSNDSDQAQAYNQVTNAPHKAELSHELIGGAAAYEAMRQFDKHQASNGKPPSHAEAKELIAGFAGAFIDNLVETKGLDAIDQQKAKHHAKQQAEEALANSGTY